jgi:hypothetical protein
MKRSKILGGGVAGDLLLTKRKDGFLARFAEVCSVWLSEEFQAVTSAGYSRESG